MFVRSAVREIRKSQKLRCGILRCADLWDCTTISVRIFAIEWVLTKGDDVRCICDAKEEHREDSKNILNIGILRSEYGAIVKDKCCDTSVLLPAIARPHAMSAHC